jgi:hypothetical protein
MRRLDRRWRFVLLLVSATLVENAFAQTTLHLKFGLESTEHYREESTTITGTAAIRSQPHGNERSYRFFTTNQTWPDFVAAISDRHLALWDSLKKEAKGTPFSMDEETYAKEVQKHDPFLLGMINGSAPQLYFDFTGRSGTEYVLEAIEVQTIKFEEYRGGGFFNCEAWYDILLRHSPGKHVYAIDRRLRFTGSGRTVLRFWSDNWYPLVGMAPQGCYLIKITFVFQVDGREERITTGEFKIDV